MPVTHADKCLAISFFILIKDRGIRKLILGILLFLFIGVSSFSCGLASSLNTASVKDKNILPGDSLKLQKTFTVTGKVTQTFSYCGGAVPPKQVLDKLKAPVAYPEKKFYIRAGSLNNIENKILESFVTDSSGEFSVQLAPGIYSIILEEQLNRIRISDYVTKNQKADEECLHEWWSRPYYLLEVKDENINQLNFTFHHVCFVSADIPCLQYTGPALP